MSFNFRCTIKSNRIFYANFVHCHCAFSNFFSYIHSFSHPFVVIHFSNLENILNHTHSKSTFYLFRNSFAHLLFVNRNAASRLYLDVSHHIPYFFFINSSYRLVPYPYSHVCDTALLLVVVVVDAVVVLFKDLDFFLTCTMFPPFAPYSIG